MRVAIRHLLRIKNGHPANVNTCTCYQKSTDRRQQHQILGLECPKPGKSGRQSCNDHHILYAEPSRVQHTAVELYDHTRLADGVNAILGVP
jgi:hypothetical protein